MSSQGSKERLRLSMPNIEVPRERVKSYHIHRIDYNGGIKELSFVNWSK